MEFFTGNKRLVITLPRLGVVLKFPIIHFIETLLTFFWGLKNRTNFMFLVVFLKGSSREGFSTTFRGQIFGGILENWRERSFFNKTRNVFLQPTYFSLFGLMNIQKIGNTLKSKEREFRYKIDPIIGDDFYKDPHHLSNPENFCVENGKLKIFDYGSLECQDVIEKHGTKIYETFDVSN